MLMVSSNLQYLLQKQEIIEMKDNIGAKTVFK